MTEETPKLLTQTKTRTKAVVGIAVVLAVLGGLAFAAFQSGSRVKVCDSGPKAGQRCNTNEQCKLGFNAPNAKCVVKRPPPPQLPDLSIGGTSLSCFNTGGTLTYELSYPGVVNQGNGSAAASVTRVSLRKINLTGSIPTFETQIYAEHPTQALAPAEAMIITGTIPAEFMSANHVIGIEGKSDATSVILESNEENNVVGPYYVSCPLGRPLFALSPASPVDASVPGVSDILRFTVTAPAMTDIVIGRLTFELNTTDNNGAGWNQWQGPEEIQGLGTADFNLFDAADLATPLSAVVRLWGNDGQDPLDGVSNSDGDEISDTGEVVHLVRFDFLAPLQITAGTTKTLSLKVDTTGASAAADDIIQASLVVLNPTGGPIFDETSSFDANPANDIWIGTSVIWGEGTNGTVPLIRPDEPSTIAQVRIGVGISGIGDSFEGIPFDGLPVIGNTLTY